MRNRKGSTALQPLAAAAGLQLVADYDAAGPDRVQLEMVGGFTNFVLFWLNKYNGYYYIH